MISIQLNQVGNRNDFFAQGAIASALLFVEIRLCRVLVEKEAEECGILLQDQTNAIFFPILLCPVKVNQHVLLSTARRVHGSAWLARDQGKCSFLASILTALKLG